MKRPLLLRLAATLCFLTGLSHTVGTFMPIPDNQIAMRATVAVMRQTMIPMPVGAPRSYLQVLDGNNLCTSLLLLLLGVLLLTLAPAPKNALTDRLIWVTALATGGFAVLSACYFFPIPVLFTGLAAALSIVAAGRPAAV